MFKIKDICRFLILTVIFVINVSAVYAQTWDMQRLKSIKKVKAEVLGVYTSQKMLNLKVISNPSTGEYKQGWCYVDGQTRISKQGSLIQLSDLENGDLVNVGGVIYSNAKKSCKFVEVINGKSNQAKSHKKIKYENKVYSTLPQPKTSSKSVLVR